MLNELMLAQQIETMQRLHLAWIEFESQVDVEVEHAPGGFRHAIAAGLVRLGMQLDRSAGDALAQGTGRSGNQEAHHAL
jgi:hypothetical protein